MDIISRLNGYGYNFLKINNNKVVVTSDYMNYVLVDNNTVLSIPETGESFWGKQILDNLGSIIG